VCSHDAGDAGNPQRVALRHALTTQQAHDLGADEHPAGGHRRTTGDVLGADVDHAGRTCGVDVGQAAGFGHPCRRSRTMTGTGVPTGSSVISSGTTARALAWAIDAIRCEPAPPTGVAT